MARARKAGDRAGADKRRIEQYDHKGQKRRNNPPVGLVTEATDRDAPKRRYAYDPHLDPTPTWAGKAEHTSFEVPTVSLYVHEHYPLHGVQLQVPSAAPRRPAKDFLEWHNEHKFRG